MCHARDSSRATPGGGNKIVAFALTAHVLHPAFGTVLLPLPGMAPKGGGELLPWHVLMSAKLTALQP